MWVDRPPIQINDWFIELVFKLWTTSCHFRCEENSRSFVNGKNTKCWRGGQGRAFQSQKKSGVLIKLCLYPDELTGPVHLNPWDKAVQRKPSLKKPGIQNYRISLIGIYSILASLHHFSLTVWPLKIHDKNLASFPKNHPWDWYINGISPTFTIIHHKNQPFMQVNIPVPWMVWVIPLPQKINDHNNDRPRGQIFEWDEVQRGRGEEP